MKNSIAIDDLFAYHFYSSLVFYFTMVLAYFIFQGRCSRENCKYLHPPPHLKTQLEINGRNNLIQQKNMAMLAQQMQLANAMMPGAPLQPVVSTLSSSSLSVWPSAPRLCRSSDCMWAQATVTMAWYFYPVKFLSFVPKVFGNLKASIASPNTLQN